MTLYMPIRLTLEMIRTMQHRKFPLEINLLKGYQKQKKRNNNLKEDKADDIIRLQE